MPEAVAHLPPPPILRKPRKADARRGGGDRQPRGDEEGVPEAPFPALRKATEIISLCRDIATPPGSTWRGDVRPPCPAPLTVLMEAITT